MTPLARRLADWVVPRLHSARALRALGKRLLRNRVVKQPFHTGVICMDAVQHSWAWTGVYRLDARDAPIQERLLALSRSCQAMVDVGSNLGTMAISVALRNRDIRVICIEPNRRTCELLRQSLALNRLTDRVTVIEAVAGGTDGEIGFEEGGSTTGHVAPDAAVRKPMIDLARLIDQQASHGRCLVKIDVEGFEAALLKDLCRVRHLRNVALLVEVHALGFNGCGDPRACVESLRDSGAVVTDLDGQPVTSVEAWTDTVKTMQLEASWLG
jgi:FkbM family methyltransferase